MNPNKINISNEYNFINFGAMNFSTGQRITTRGEDFLITKLLSNTDGSFIIDAEGISDLVKGKRFSFDTSIDTDIKAVDPLSTRFEADTDTGYRKTKLYLETHIRNSTVFSDAFVTCSTSTFLSQNILCSKIRVNSLRTSLTGIV